MISRGIQHGSAITEFIITLSVLIPIAMLFSLIGKLSDAEHAAQQSARYSAWERTLSSNAQKSDDVVAAEIHKRVITKNAFIQSNDGQSDTDNQADRVLWGMYGRTSGAQREALISFDEDGYDFGSNNNSIGGALQVPSMVTTGMSGIEDDGLIDGNVSFAVNNVSWLGFDGEVQCGHGTLDSYLSCMKRNNSILVDDWSAASPDTVRYRVKERMPFSLDVWEPIADVLGDAEDAIGTFSGIYGGYNPFKDINRIDEAPGYVLPDVVPARRLGVYEDEGITEELD